MTRCERTTISPFGNPQRCDLARGHVGAHLHVRRGGRKAVWYTEGESP